MFAVMGRLSNLSLGSIPSVRFLWGGAAGMCSAGDCYSLFTPRPIGPMALTFWRVGLPEKLSHECFQFCGGSISSSLVCK